MPIGDKILLGFTCVVLSSPCTLAGYVAVRDAARHNKETAQFVSELTQGGYGDVAEFCTKKGDWALDCLRKRVGRLRRGENPREIPNPPPVRYEPVSSPPVDTFVRQRPSDLSPSEETRRQTQFVPSSFRDMPGSFSSMPGSFRSMPGRSMTNRGYGR